MKKPDKRELANLFFSAFLIIAFIICAKFFSQFANGLQGVGGQLISIAVFAVFGLLLFYATRVGDGKAVKRFSLVTLLVMVVPSLYIIIASLAKFLPLNGVFAPDNMNQPVTTIVALAAVAIGYGIPYTFISGFETEPEEAVETETNEVLAGGVEADVLESAEEEIPDEAVETDEPEAE